MSYMYIIYMHMFNSCKPASAVQGLLSGLSDPTIMDMYMYCVRTHTHIHTSSPHSRGFPFLEQNGREGDVENNLLDLARHWLELQLNVMLKGHGGGILHHVNGFGGQDLPLAC